MSDTTDRLPTYDDLNSQIGDYGTPQDAARVRFVRDAHKERIDSIISTVERSGATGLSASEQRAFDAHRSQITQLDALVARCEERSNAEARVRRDYGSNESRTQGGDSRFYTSGGHTYRKGDQSGPSWINDLVQVSLRSDPAAAERLHRNQAEVRTEHRALSTTDGAGGDFVPPLWMVNQYVELARAQRITANLVSRQQLPAGTDQINVPRISTGTAVAEQAAQNTPVQNTDMTTGQVAANVATLAGQQVVALQLIEQSPINVDEMILGDLLADYASKVNLFVLNNNATGKKGLLQEASTNAITYTSGTPTAKLLYGKLAEARLGVETGRYAAPTAIVMHPRRWADLLRATDTTDRPLVTPEANGPYNALAGDAGIADPRSGRVGTMMGLPVYVDPMIPTNLGAGTNQDPILVLKTDDSILWEGLPRAEAFRETKADQLSVLLRVYNYVAFTAARQPKSISVISGTGLVAPTF